MLDASVGSGMTMDRAYTCKEEGVVICCWDAPDTTSVEQLFDKAGVTYEKITPVQEHLGSAFSG